MRDLTEHEKTVLLDHLRTGRTPEARRVLRGIREAFGLTPKVSRDRETLWGRPCRECGVRNLSHSSLCSALTTEAKSVDYYYYPEED